MSQSGNESMADYTSYAAAAECEIPISLWGKDSNRECRADPTNTVSSNEIQTRNTDYSITKRAQNYYSTASTEVWTSRYFNLHETKEKYFL